jgi:AAA family ATP:ADP antiporter
VRPAISPSILASGAVLFAVMAAHGLLETARDAIFLASLGPDRLASAYLAIAAAALGAMRLARRWRAARHPRRLLIGFLAFAALGTGAIAATLGRAPELAFALYVWTGLVATLVVPSFWLAVERGLRVGEAKRALGALAAGGTAGMLAGSAAAAALGGLIPARHLVTAAAVVFALAATAAAVLVPRGGADRAPRAAHTARGEASDAPGRSARYVRLLLVLGVASTATLTLGDLTFKRLLAERLDADVLAAVFGAIYAGLNALGLAVQLAATARLLERAGVGAALMLLPSIVLAGALGFAAAGAVAAVIALKLADGGLRHGVHRVASELLFLPLPAAARDAAKPVVDVIGQRGGQALAALAAMAVAGDAAGTRALGLLTALVAAAWLAVAARARGAYVRQFRAGLEARDIQRDARVPSLDADSVELLTSALSSPDEAEAAAALDLLALRQERVPALVLYHPSPAIVRRALASLEGELRPDVARVLERLVVHADPRIRAAALAAASRTGCHADRLASALSDPEPDVRAAAVVGLAGGPHAGAAEAALQALLAGSAQERAALAHAIGRAPREAHRGVLVQLLARREPAVVREVVQVWERTPSLADGARLLEMLDHPHVRGDVRRAFLAGDHLERLLAALQDPRTPLGVRRHLPRTISRFRSPVAAAALVARLSCELDGTTEFKLLRALGRMRADDPALAIDPQPVRAYVRRALDDAGRYRRLARALGRHGGGGGGPALDLLAELLVEKRRHAIERAFRGLGILYPTAALRGVHDAITSSDDQRRAAAREIADGVLPANERARLLDELEARDSSAAPAYATLEAVLAALLVDHSDSLRCIAAHHVAQRRLVALRGELARLRPTAASAFVTRAFDQAIESLDA